MQPQKLSASRVEGIEMGTDTSTLRDNRPSVTLAASEAAANEPGGAVNVVPLQEAVVHLATAAAETAASNLVEVSVASTALVASAAMQSTSTAETAGQLLLTSDRIHYENMRSETGNSSKPDICAHIESEETLSLDGIGRRVGPHKCSDCNQPIVDRYLLKAMERYWHEDCLKCSCCGCRLGEVGCTLFTKAGLLLCRRDYLRLFGENGYCCVCSKLIPAFELVMRSRDNVYHIDCFACQQCNHRFCVGDRYFVHHNIILCEYDYYQKLYSGPDGGNISLKSRYPLLPSGDITTSHMQGNPDITDDSSSGYGSPSPTAS